MYLVLCPSDDASAIWAYHGLRRGGLAPLELVTSRDLAFARRWEHRLGADGIRLDVTLADGRRIGYGDVAGALNRLQYAPAEGMLLFQPAEREYVQQELGSFYLSWLSALPGPVLNRPSPWDLSGAWLHLAEWLQLASRAGLPTPRFRQSSRDLGDPKGTATRIMPDGAAAHMLIVVGDSVVGAPAPPHIQDGCRRLAALTHTPLLGVEMTTSPSGDWAFASATPHPDLRLGGQPLLDALVYALRDGAEASP